MVCLLVAIFSSYKLLAVPDLKPGDISQFNEIAPRDATVIDTEALREKRQRLKESFVQVIDKNQSINLEKIVFQKIKNLRALKNSNFEGNSNEFNPSSSEKIWLDNVSDSEWEVWKEEVKNASKKMLSQGIINTLALDQLNEASSLQLIDLGDINDPSRSLGSKILSSSFYQKSNLKIDTLRTNILLEKLINKDGVNTIKVKKGSIISKKGEPISSKDFDILEHFNKVSRSPRPLKWLITFSE